MTHRHYRRMTALLVGSIIMAVLGSAAVAYGSTTRAVNKQTAQSANAFGGMAALVAAAKKEGKLNIIACPNNWADYGQIIKQFQKQFGIKITSENPNGNSQDEVNAVIQLKGTSRQPDVVDLGANVMLANTKLFAPYKVVNWAHIPASLKSAKGIWYADYAGYESIGYDANVVKPAPTSVNDLLKSAYRGMVALNGDPSTASAAFHGVVMCALARGGSASNIQKGIDFFKSLKQAGNFLPVDPTPATIASGQTPIVIDWDYNQLGAKQSLPAGSSINWKWIIPKNDVVSAFYEQAVVKGCPHPAAARLWEEYLYSTAKTGGQNWWLRGGAHPVFQAWMTATGTIDTKALAALPKVVGTPVSLTQAQLATGQALVSAQWPNLR